MNLLIVIVNYRSAGLAIDCLRSLEPEVAAIPGARAVVVENASGDDSADRLAAAIERERLGLRGPRWWSPLGTAGSPRATTWRSPRPWRRPTPRITSGC